MRRQRPRGSEPARIPYRGRRFDAAAMIDGVKPWSLTADPPKAVDEVIQGEHEVLRKELLAVICRLQPTPISVTAALFAVADVAAFLCDYGAEMQHRLKIKSQDQLGLEATFVTRFRYGLKRAVWASRMKR